MTALLTLPGFAINPDQRDNDQLPKRWLELFGAPFVPHGQPVPAVVMFSLQRPKDLGRLEIYYDELLRLGFRVHVRIHEGAGVGMHETKMRYPQVTVALGNGTRSGDGLLRRGDVLEDDAGIRSAVHMARTKPGLPIAFHEYGAAGFEPMRHLRLLRHWYPDQTFWMTEAAWSFEPFDPGDGTATTAALPPHQTEAAGVYCRNLVNVAAIHRIPVTLFRGIDYFLKMDGGDYKPTPAALALIDAREYTYGFKPPLRAARNLSVGMYRRQYLPL